jgi:hypothetical protein
MRQSADRHASLTSKTTPPGVPGKAGSQNRMVPRSGHSVVYFKLGWTHGRIVDFSFGGRAENPHDSLSY